MKLRLQIVVPLLFVAGCLAVAIPNVYTTMQRSRQKRTMADLRTWVEDIEAYMTKHGTAPRRGYAGPIAGIAPLVASKAPATDAWGHPFLYHASANHYSIRSTGRDGKNDHLVSGKGKSFDDDILFADGIFQRYVGGF